MASRKWNELSKEEQTLIKKWNNATKNVAMTNNQEILNEYDKRLALGGIPDKYIYSVASVNDTTSKIGKDLTNIKGTAYLSKDDKEMLKDWWKSQGNTYSIWDAKNDIHSILQEYNKAFSNGTLTVSDQPSTIDTRNQDFYNMLGTYDQSIRNNLMLNPNDANALAYKQNMYGALDQYQATADASLAATEMSAYAMLGQQQLELESAIAEQRMKALKSGTTSAQLASQQLANMFAAQSGAAQVANNMMQTKMSNANKFAQSRYGITQDMYSMINANQQTYANAQAQLGAIAGSYASTMNQPYAQYNAYEDLYNRNPALAELLNTTITKAKG